MRRLIITTGDVRGIGVEITAKALAKTPIRRGASVNVVLHPSSVSEFRTFFHGPLTISRGPIIQKASSQIHIITDDRPPAFWVEDAARHCLRGTFDALVTGPLSKPEIQAAGLKDIGHTDILARISRRRNLLMSFWGSQFNVVLVTGHIPIHQVEAALTVQQITRAANLTQAFLMSYNPRLARKPIGWVGLNPHAGDQGLMGSTEARLKNLRRLPNLVGPLVPDTCFQPENWTRFAAYLAAYHDQGLIPFKLVHGFDEGVHVTLGLPFLRTSVDHGPAFEIAGTGTAKFGSMKAAIEMALKFKQIASR